jgi:hypothetical protein
VGTSKSRRRFWHRFSSFDRLEDRFLLAALPIITEFSASNDSVLVDGDRNTPDWIEIHNAGDQPIDLEGWHLTDDSDDLAKWTFPAQVLAARDYLVVFASGNDKVDSKGNLHTNFRLSTEGEYLGLVDARGNVITELEPQYPQQFVDVSYGIPMGETDSYLISVDSPAQLLVPTDDRYGLEWTKPTFSPDANWIAQVGGQPTRASVGFETNSGFAGHFQTNTGSLMHGLNSSIYVRIPFSVDQPDEIDDLVLRMKYDDGFIVYLNGTLLDLRNAPFFRAFNSTATAPHANEEAVVSEEIDLTEFRHLLLTGQNVLGIQGLNLGPADPDFLISPELVTSISQIRPGEFGYFSAPSPNGANPGEFTLGPRIRDAGHSPTEPTAEQPVLVTARGEKTLHNLANVELVYRVMYDDEVHLPMKDDGQGPDQTANDGLYSALIPAAVAQPGQMLRYYITATDQQSNLTREPRITDAAGVDRSPEYFGTVIQDPTLTSQLPIFHWFSEQVSRARNRTGARVSVSYNGQFYDNVYARQRGGATNGASQKFNFGDDHPFFVNDSVGHVAELNMNAQGSDPTFLRQTLAFDTYTLAGHESLESFLVHMRVNGNEDRVGVFVEQVDANFLTRHGLDPEGALYKMVQRGNLDPVFSDVTTGIEKQNRLNEGLVDLKVVVDGLTAATEQARVNSVYDNFNVAQLLNYLALRSITMDADDVRKNFYLYRDTNGTGQWSIFPWDKDWTFGVEGDGGTHLSHPFFGDFAHRKQNADQWNRLYDVVFNNPVTRQMFLRRLRTLMDELLQPPGTDPADGLFERRVDQLYALADADLPSSVANQVRALKNFFPRRRDTLYNDHSIDQLSQGEIIDLIAEFAQATYFVPKDNSLGTTWTAVANPPNAAEWKSGQTGLGYGASAGFSDLIKTQVTPAEGCAACTSIYVRIPFDVADPSSVEALTLRMKFDDGYIAYLNGVEVARKGLNGDPSFDSRASSRANALAVTYDNVNISQHRDQLRPGRNVLAIHSINQSATSNDQLVLPVLVDGIIGSSVAAGIPHAQVGNPQIRFGAVEHNPAADQNQEYIELKNMNSVAVDISGWQLTGGIDHTFPPGTVIASGRSIYVTPDARAFSTRTSGPRGGQGLFIQGNYQGHLSNFGDTVRLIAADGQVMDTLTTPVTPSDPQLYLRVSEVHYNPAGPGDATEFIELVNIRSAPNAPLDLSGVQIVEGPNQTFILPEGTSLSAGGRLVVARNKAAMLAAYPGLAADQVIGDLSGLLNNAGERIKINDRTGSTIVDFEFGDGSLWPDSADGAGASLVFDDPFNTPADQIDKAYRWRGSVEFGGSPGQPEQASIPVVINEVFANTDRPGQLDSIELVNLSNQAVNIGGWYLSDSADDLPKYRIPDGTVLGSGEYFVVDESDFNIGANGDDAFALDGVNGDDVWLVIGGANDQVVSFVDDVHFGGSRPGESLSRWPNGAGRVTAAERLSLGATNAPPRKPTVTISEIHYHPARVSGQSLSNELEVSDLEFIEIHNGSGQPVDMTNWRIRGGVDFDFPRDFVLGPGKTLAVLSFDPATPANGAKLAGFQSQFDIPGDAQLLGAFAGILSDSQQDIRLERVLGETAAAIIEDQVIYDDRMPWPAADGTGSSLARKELTSYGNDPGNWRAASPTPGSQQVVPSDLNGDGIANVADIDVLCGQVQAGSVAADLNQDGLRNEHDVRFYVENGLGTSIGDSNLDGVFNSSDLVATFQVGEYEDGIAGNSTWAEGDWFCDNEFNTRDFVFAFQYSRYSQAAVAAFKSNAIIGAILAEHEDDPAFARSEANNDRALANTDPLDHRTEQPPVAAGYHFEHSKRSRLFGNRLSEVENAIDEILKEDSSDDLGTV